MLSGERLERPEQGSAEWRVEGQWQVPPPNVERAELERIEAEIEAEFPTLRAE